MSNSEAPKKKSKAPIIVIAAVIILVIAVIANLGNSDDSKEKDNKVKNETTESNKDTKDAAEDTKEADTEPTAEPTKEAAAAEPFKTTLSAGFYTAGVDFPSGKYDLRASSGNGNVFTDDTSLNETMGVDDDEMYIKDYKNADLSDGTVLAVSGNLVLDIRSKEAAVSEQKPRTNDLSETIKLSSGNYVAGEDFPAGVYNVVAADGAGNVYTEDGGLNETMGTDPDDMYIKEFKNVVLDKGNKLTVEDVTINLVPSK